MIADAISAFIGWRPWNASIENPSMSLQDPRTWDELLRGSESEAGIRVTQASAMTLGPVFQALSTISGDVATATLNVFNVVENDDREIDWDHEAQPFVAVQPNEEMCAFELWRRLMVHALLWPAGYLWVSREGRSSRGRMLGLYNLLPDRTVPKRMDDGTLFFVSEIAGVLEPFRADEIIPIKGVSVDNTKGCDLVESARNCWGLALAAEGFGSKFFRAGAQAGGFLEIPATWTEKAKAVLSEGFDKKYTGKDNWFKTVILRDGAKFHASTIDAQKSQMHELREDQVRDTARFFNLPPYKLGLSDSVSYNSQEQSQINYLTGCLNHWFATVRGACNIKLLNTNDRMSGKRYLEHNVSKLLEVDTKTMNEVLNIQRTAEVINANEWRRKIGLNKRKDPGGEDYTNPNTKSGFGGGGSPPEPKPAKTPKNAARDLFCDTVNRVARRVGFDARSASRKPQKFAAWLDGKAQEHRAVFTESLAPVLRVMVAEGDGADSATLQLLGMEGRFFGSLLDSLSPVVEPPFSTNDLAANVDSRCSEFEATIAETLYQTLKGTV